VSEWWIRDLLNVGDAQGVVRLEYEEFSKLLLGVLDSSSFRWVGAGGGSLDNLEVGKRNEKGDLIEAESFDGGGGGAIGWENGGLAVGPQG